MEEIWEDIKGYEGLYQISNLGNIKSNYIWTGRMYIYKPHLIKPTIAKNGYYRVSLCKEGKTKYRNLHKLIAETFISNPEGYKYINHIDGDKLNNNLKNLEWCTQSHNTKEAFRIGLHKKYFGADNKRSKKIIQYDLHGNFIKEWDYMTKITEELGFDYTNISKCCSGVYKKSHGYIWKYKDGV